MFSEIPKLTSSSDYPRWSQTVAAYLGVEKAGLSKTAPILATNGSNQDAVDAWDECEDIARGVIILTLHPTIAEAVDPAKSVKDIWAGIKDKYGKPGPSGIYLEFKKVLGVEISTNADPSLALETLKTGFTKLKSLGCEIPHKIQVLMYMSKLSGPGLDHIAQDLGASPDLDKINIDELERLVRMNWEQRSSKKPPQQAAKISAVKPSSGEPQFSEQQGEKPKKKSRRGGKKNAAKAIQEEQPTASGSAQDGYAQLASTAFTSQLTSSAFFMLSMQVLDASKGNPAKYITM
jgi:hypothetical protein